MNKIKSLLLLLLFVGSLLVSPLFFTEACLADSAKKLTQNSDDDWVIMPAGGKQAYMGIHGGTMPVSLLVSRDGTSLLSFVGRTGNDFLEVLRNAKSPLPSIGNATGSRSQPLALGEAKLYAGNATSIMPVINISGDILASYSPLKLLQPFGLSEEPLLIEGQVKRPQQSFSPEKKHRQMFMNDFFQPRDKSQK